MLIGLAIFGGIVVAVYFGSEYFLSYWRQPYDKNTHKASVVLTCACALSLASLCIFESAIRGRLGESIGTSLAAVIGAAGIIIASRILRTNGRFVWPRAKR